MHNTYLEETNEPVEKREIHIRESLKDLPINFIGCSGSHQGSAAVTILDEKSFIEACKAIKPSAVFVYKEFSGIEEQILSAISDISDDPSEQERLIVEFFDKESETLSKVSLICPVYYRCQCYFFTGPAIIVTGCEASPYAKVMSALDGFEDYIKSLKKSERDKWFVELQKKLDGVAERVAEDEGFIAIRGRRKRAMYVLQNYRSEIPESRQFEKPGQDGDYMDKNIVEVSKRAADIIEFGLSASPFYDDE